MANRRRKRLLALGMGLLLLLAACGAPARTEGGQADSRLTWGTWGSYGSHKDFLDLLGRTYPDIELDFLSYTGANRTGYSWAQMRADDIPDIFITSQLLDKDLAKERLADLSVYPFMEQLSVSVLDHTQIDGAVYLLPVSYAMYGVFYNKTLMEEKGWRLPANFNELEALCADIRAEGLIPGVVGTQLTGGPFSTVFNLAKTDWLATPGGMAWEKDFLAGTATAAGAWEGTMDYVQRYIDIGMLHPDPEDRGNAAILNDYLGGRKAVFFTAVFNPDNTVLDNGDEVGMMPYISQNGSRNLYMYNPPCYFGLSKRLTRPGNEKKLEQAVRILSLLFSEEGQEALLGSGPATNLRVLSTAVVPEDSILYDAQQAMGQGRAFPMTYANWEHILADVGQAYKDWFRGDADGAQCVARMDQLQQSWLSSQDQVNFCESTGNFTLAETASLVGQALGSAAGADAVMVPLGEFHAGGVELTAGITGKLYAGKINSDVASTLCPGYTAEYALMTMTGARARETAQAGFDPAGEGDPFPYLLVVKGNGELKDGETYQVAFFARSYTEELAAACSAQVREGSVSAFVRDYLTRQKSVSPGVNYWK